MQISSFEVVYYTSIFILPGLITNSIISVLNTHNRKSETIYFLNCLLYSLINLACWGWLYQLVTRKMDKESPILLLSYVCIAIVGALIIGIVLGLLKRHIPITKLLKRMGAREIGGETTAWDKLFCDMKSSVLMVRLHDGTEIQGWFSSDSYSSSLREEKDLYLENIYIYSEEKEGYVLSDYPQGMYIAKDQIQYITVYEVKGEDNESKQRKQEQQKKHRKQRK